LSKGISYGSTAVEVEANSMRLMLTGDLHLFQTELCCPAPRISHMKIIPTLAALVLLQAAILSARADNDGRSDINMGDDRYGQLGQSTPGYVHVSGPDRQYNQNVIRHFVDHAGNAVPGSAFSDKKTSSTGSDKSVTSTAKGSSPAASASTTASAGK
jgi:hypothetical protein